MVVLQSIFLLFVLLREVSLTDVQAEFAAPVAPTVWTLERCHECSEEQLSLLQVEKVHSDSARRHAKAKRPEAEWFGGFAQAESTYTYGGRVANPSENPEAIVRDGWNPHEYNTDPFEAVDHISERWFQETRSDARKQAWQTFYPATAGTLSAAGSMETGHWFPGTGGVWQQEYRGYHPTQFMGETGLPAQWFDSFVNQIDGYGRRYAPDLNSPRGLLNWEERSVNTTLSCKKPGCIANASLLAPFDWNTEHAKDCTMSVFFHPTDFDDAFKDERVQWVLVNNEPVSSNCRPRLDGCNSTASRPLVPCVHQIPLDMLMPENGGLTVTAKIAEVVDECPYQGNYLSAVPEITCLVRKKNPPIPHSHSAALVGKDGKCHIKVPMTCATKGCAAQVFMSIPAHCAALGKCSLSVNVTQTDYDNEDGTSEIIEYIKVGTETLGSKLKPGKNPCKSKWKGKPLPNSELTFSAVKDHMLKNITGRTIITVEGKISNFVDECPSDDGFLFDALAEVVCSKTGT